MKGDSFGRIVKVRVYATIIEDQLSDGTLFPRITYSQGYTEFSSVQPDGQPGFRIKGRATQVQPTVGFNTNQIQLSMYNLGPDSRAIIQSKVGTKIAIFAGYGDDVRQIALGDILWANTHKEQDASYITEIIAGDSHFALSNGEINTSFTGAVSYKTLFQVLFTKLEEQDIFVASPAGNIPDGGFNNGYVLHGSAFVELSNLCKKLNLGFNIIGGGIYIIPPGKSTGAPIIDISEDTGLIGIPEVQPPGIIGVQQNTVPVTPENDVSFTHLLRADLSMWQRVRINSKFIKGEYDIQRVEFDFDSWSGPFYAKCQAAKVLSNVGG